MKPLRLVGIGILVGLAVGGFSLMGLQSERSIRSSDFVISYSAALLVRQGQAASAYRQAQLAPVLERVSGGTIDPLLPFNMPLAAVLPVVPLTYLPLEIAFRLWQLINLAALLISLALLARVFPLGRHALWLGALALAAMPPSWALLSEGQPSGLLLLGAALVVLGIVRSSGYAVAGGMGLLALKPQFLPAYLLLVAMLCWREALLATGGAVLVVCSSILAGGSQGLISWMQQAISANAGGRAGLNESLLGLAAPVVPPGWLLPLTTVVLLVGLLGLMLVIRSVRPAVSAGTAVAATLTVLASPHVLPHDLVLLAVPGWVALYLHRVGRLGNPVVPLALVGIGALVDVRGLGFPVVPLLLAAVLCWAVVDFRRRCQASSAVPALAA